MKTPRRKTPYERPHSLQGLPGPNRNCQPRRNQRLQLERLKWSLRHAYDNVPFYKASFDAAGVHPDDLNPFGSGQIPLHRTNRPARQLPVWHVCRPARTGRPYPRLLRHDRQPTVVGYTKRSGYLGGRRGPVAARVGPAHAAICCTIAYGYGLFTGGLGAHCGAERWAARCPDLGGHDRTPGASDRGFQTHGHHWSPRLYAVDSG